MYFDRIIFNLDGDLINKIQYVPEIASTANISPPTSTIKKGIWI